MPRTSLLDRGRATSPAATGPPPAGHRGDRAVNPRVEIGLTRTSLVVSLVAFGAFWAGMSGAVVAAVGDGAVGRTVEWTVFALVVTFLVYGNFVYQAARLGYFLRLRDHRPTTRAELDRLYEGPVRPLVALIPSYREEPDVIRHALMSAAIQEYPAKHVVLLIDDPPDPGDEEGRRLLEAARELPRTVEALLGGPAERARSALAAFEARPLAGRTVDEVSVLAALHESAARWFEDRAAAEAPDDHTAAVFVEQVLREAARTHRDDARELLERRPASVDTLRLGYRRLLARFEVTVTAFERKRYVNLSHEPNKAMNLNSYVGLLGRPWREEGRPDGRHLVPADGEADIAPPDSTYVVTLDADSVLVPNYAARLVEVLEQPGNEQVAVAQTPYSAIPGPPGALERTAGATTDIQYIIHQGFTHHGATFWVGANALIRRSALDDLVAHDVERGFPVRRYIQDRTVIEDTESSVDLIDRGWQLLNYPERLSYSATPPDFGSLVIQRRRWANGGLIILPKLLRHILGRRRRTRPSESLMRLHYLTSITGVNVGLLLLLGYPFGAPEASAWIPLIALPYFLLYGRDLRQAGYGNRELVRVYALNLLLLPINIAGVLKSLQQAATKRKIPFGRTPKVAGRTRAPALYVAMEFCLLAYWSLGVAVDLTAERWVHAVFGAANVGLLAYAVGRFIGWRHALVDAFGRRPGR